MDIEVMNNNLAAPRARRPSPYPRNNGNLTMTTRPTVEIEVEESNTETSGESDTDEEIPSAEEVEQMMYEGAATALSEEEMARRIHRRKVELRRRGHEVPNNYILRRIIMYEVQQAQADEDERPITPGTQPPAYEEVYREAAIRRENHRPRQRQSGNDRDRL